MQPRRRRVLLSVLSFALLFSAPRLTRAGNDVEPVPVPKKEEPKAEDTFRGKGHDWWRALTPSPEDKSAASGVYQQVDELLKQKQAGDAGAAAQDPSGILRDFLEDEAFPSAKVSALRNFTKSLAEAELGAAPPSPQVQRAQEINDMLRDVMREKRWSSENRLHERPNDPQAHADAGGLQFMDHDYRESIRSLREGLRMNPGDGRMHYTMARDLYELGDFKESARSASKAIQTDPKNSGAWRARAAAAFKMEDWNQAYSDAHQAHALNPDDHMAATIEKIAKQRIDGVNIQSLKDIKPLFDDTDRVAEALKAIPERRSARPSQTARAAPAETPKQQDDSHFASSLEPNAGGPPPSYRAQSFYKEALNKLELGDYQAAAESATHSIALAPTSPEPYAARASAYNYLGRFQDAVNDASKSLDFDRQNHVALNARAWALNHGGRPKEALEDARAAVQLAPRDAFAYLNKAMAEEALGQWDAGEKDYQAAAQLEPEFKANYEAASQRFEQATGKVFKGLAALRHGDAPSPAATTRRFAFGAAALLAGLGGGFLLAFLIASSVRSDEKSPAGAATVTQGAVIGGCYQVGRELGRGGMGVVFEADDLALGRKVALKRMKDDLKNKPLDKEHFMEEARTVAALKHPNIVAIHSIFEEEGDLYLVFELVTGMTLDEHLYRRKKLSPSEAHAILKPVCDALGYAHGRKVVHRDLKPANIMLGDDGVVKVMDFGLARQAKDTLAALSRTDAAGTPAYMAPEMERGVARRESDLYMLGGVLYEMLTGELLSRKDPDFSGLPPEIASVIKKAMSKDPELRYTSAQSFLDSYETALKLITQR